MIELDKIYNEDCLIGMQRIPDGSVDCIICDLPYGTTQNKWDSIIPLPELWAEYKRIAKPNAAIVLFSQQPFTSVLACSNLNMFRYEWIWQKIQGTGFLNAKKMPMKAHENILVFYKELPTYYPQMRKGKGYNVHSGKSSTNYREGLDGVHCVSNGDYYPLDYVEFDYDRAKKMHPTQKPVDLIAYLVRTYSNEGDTILDNCMGSGTTAIACIREKRHFIGFEMNGEYYAKSLKRIEAEKSQLALCL